METNNKILEMIAAEDKTLSVLAAQTRAHSCRASAFESVLSAINGAFSASARRNVENSLERERAAIKEIELKIDDSKTRKAAFKEAITMIESSQNRLFYVDEKTIETVNSHKDLREGTDIYRVRELLRKNEKPMLLSEIVAELFGSGEMDVKHGKYANLRGTLTGYASEGRIFTIESKSPHVIGLREFNELKGGFKIPL